MKCPIDNSDLQMTERQGVEIDYCPKCRGVWLDRGELDKIIEKTNSEFLDNRVDTYSTPSSGHHGGYGGKYKKRGFLGDLFHF